MGDERLLHHLIEDIGLIVLAKVEEYRVYPVQRRDQ